MVSGIPAYFIPIMEGWNNSSGTLLMQNTCTVIIKYLLYIDSVNLFFYNYTRSNGDVVVKLSACGARGPEFEPQSHQYNISCLQVEM